VSIAHGRRGKGSADHEDGDPPAAESRRLTAVANVQVDPPATDARTGVFDNVETVVAVQPAQPDPRSHRQGGRIGSDDSFRRLRAARGHVTSAIGGCRERRPADGSLRPNGTDAAVRHEAQPPRYPLSNQPARPADGDRECDVWLHPDPGGPPERGPSRRSLKDSADPAGGGPAAGAAAARRRGKPFSRPIGAPSLVRISSPLKSGRGRAW
jgi:hypothetical protein